MGERDLRRHLPTRSDFPAGAAFVIKDFDVPLVLIPDVGWYNWFGGRPRAYNPARLAPDNNWPADSFEHWVKIVEDSLS
jgi:hypothetical protein